MILIFRAITGTGKSTLVKKLLTNEALVTHSGSRGLVEVAKYLEPVQAQIHRTAGRAFSSDDYFYAEGIYKFDAKFLSAAHGQCRLRFTEAISTMGPRPSDHDKVLIVDNTNCTVVETAVFADLAGAYNHELHIVTLLCDPAIAWQRSVHGVPFTNVIKQDLALRKSVLEWPAWWPQR